MGKIKVSTCDIEGLYVIEPTVFGDKRGYFMETYNQNRILQKPYAHTEVNTTRAKVQ